MGAEGSASPTWLVWPNQQAAKVRVREPEDEGGLGEPVINQHLALWAPPIATVWGVSLHQRPTCGCVQNSITSTCALTAHPSVSASSMRSCFIYAKLAGAAAHWPNEWEPMFPQSP